MTRCLPLLLGVLAPVSAYAAEITESEFLSQLTDDHPAFVVRTAELAKAEESARSASTANPGLEFEREAPEGTAARPTTLFSKNTSTSTVGLPRDSKISRPKISKISSILLSCQMNEVTFLQNVIQEESILLAP